MDPGDEHRDDNRVSIDWSETRSKFVLAAAAALAMSLPAASQESWPARRVTLIVPFGAGSATDVLARFLAEHFKDTLGQPFIVENRGGAGGTLGANAVAKAAPDGYTLLMGGNTTHSAAPAFFKSVPYDPVKDFTPIARIGKFASVVTTNAAQPFRSIQQLVAFVKANPGKLTYGHGNSTGQIVGEAIKKRTGIDMVRLPYPSTAPALTDLLGNTIQLMVADAAAIPQHVEAGKLFALATFQLQRSALLPGTPTLSETVMSGFEVLPWVGLFGPANLPAGVTKALSVAAETVLKRPDTPQRFATLSTEPFYAPSAELATFIEADLPKWRGAATEAGIEPQ